MLRLECESQRYSEESLCEVCCGTCEPKCTASGSMHFLWWLWDLNALPVVIYAFGEVKLGFDLLCVVMVGTQSKFGGHGEGSELT